MAIYRGPGGAGDATTDSSTEAAAAVNAAAQAATSATQAASSATQSANSATAASSSASSASTSASTATTKANEAASSASAASVSALAASTSATNAAASASTATTQANNASTSATSASTSASTAQSAATLATSKATDASNAASVATTKATEASTSASNAATSATNAASSASSASTSASTATTQASNAATSATAAAASASTATTKASEAATSATNAATSATNAANSATAAATSATNASNSASAASTSATNAASSATSAASSASAAAASYDSFDDRYLGSKSSAPTLDNDGNALLTGALYFDTTSNSMKVYNGTSWLDAYASLSGALLAANNLSDVASASSARTNLGLGTAATTAATDYATAAQGTKADTAYGWGNHASAGYAADSLVAHLAGAETITGAKTFSSTITGSISGNAGTVTNGVYTTGSYADPSWITSIAGSKVSGNISGNAATATTATNQSGGTVAATTGSFSSSVTLSGGTANGVAYLNGSKVLTTGSALTFTSTGLGIGTSSPLYKLDVSLPQYGFANFENSNASGYSGVQIKDPNQPILQLTDGTNNFQIYGGGTTVTLRNYANGAIVFSTNSSEQMRLTSTGLGIGTSSPARKLDVNGASIFRNYMTLYGTGQNSTLFLNNTAYEYAIYPDASNNLIFADWNVAQTRMTLNSSGNLGLGVTPSGKSKFEVATGNAAQNGVQVWFNSSNTPIALASTTSNGFPYLGFNTVQTVNSDNQTYAINGYASRLRANSGGFCFDTAPSGTAGNAISFTQAMTLDASGNLAIGQTSAASKLDVKCGSGSVISRSTGQSCFKAFYDDGRTTYTGVTYSGLLTNGAQDMILSAGSGASQAMIFNTSDTERMRIDSSGNLLFNSGYGSVATAYGCRAWVNFNGTGTVAIRASGNVSSITDNGTGDYTVNFSTAMPDANYGVATCGQENSNTGSRSDMNILMPSRSTSLATTGVRLMTTYASNAGAFDGYAVTVQVFR